MPEASDQGVAPIATGEWGRKIEALELLAKGVKQTSVAKQVGWSDKTIYRLKKNAMGWPVDIIVTLPEIVQDFIVSENVKKNQRPELRAELAALHKKQNEPNPFKKQFDEHQEDLSRTAKNLATRLSYIRQVARKDFTAELIGEIVIDKPFLPEVDQYLLSYLFSHIQSELPELKDIEGWGQLPIAGISDALLNYL